MSVDVRDLRRQLAQAELDEAGVQLAKYATLLILFAAVSLPYIYSFLITFFSSQELIRLEGVNWFPSTIYLTNWPAALDRLGGRLVNSLLYASGSAVLTLACGIPGAYAFARKEFPGRTVVFYVVVLSLLFPGIVLIPVLADLWIQFDIYNTIFGLWIARLPETAFVVWILRDFFEKLPTQLEDSARIYGATQFTAFTRVILPLSAPAVVAVGFLVFLGSWNDYLLANLLTSGDGVRPAAVELYYDINLIEGGASWPLFLAEAFIVGVPPVLFYMLARKQIAEGFAMS